MRWRDCNSTRIGSYAKARRPGLLSDFLLIVLSSFCSLWLGFATGKSYAGNGPYDLHFILVISLLPRLHFLRRKRERFLRVFFGRRQVFALVPD